MNIFNKTIYNFIEEDINIKYPKKKFNGKEQERYNASQIKKKCEKIKNMIANAKTQPNVPYKDVHDFTNKIKIIYKLCK